jgi:transposase-like protein
MSLPIEALVDALGALGMSGEAVDPGVNGVDLVMDIHGLKVFVEVKHRALVSRAEVVDLPAAPDRSHDDVPLVGVVVADRVLASGRETLNQLGWSWLDLRGHLHLVAPGVHVDAPVPAHRRRPDRVRALSGPAGIEVACALLLQDGGSVRGLARELGRSPSTVSTVLKALRADGLVGENGAAVVPELFWEVAAAWRPPSTLAAVVAEPAPGTGIEEKALRLGLTEIESSQGWALTDTLAAVAYGAPVAAAADYPPEFYLPDSATFRRAQKLLNTTESGRTATIRVAPVPAVCAHRVDLAHQVWPLANPLFVALDLAQDTGRGREILAQWHPDKWRRVW